MYDCRTVSIPWYATIPVVWISLKVLCGIPAANSESSDGGASNDRQAKPQNCSVSQAQKASFAKQAERSARHAHGFISDR